MEKKDAILSDLVAENTMTHESVEERINRRLEILRCWLKEGVPSGYSFPRSLTKVRTWENDDLKISVIASPNEFTTKHPLHGNAVREIADLLTALKKRFDRPASSQLKSAAVNLEKLDRSNFDNQLEIMVSQWHAERDKYLKEMKRANSAEARSVLLLEENSKKDEQIADLQRRLVTYEGLRPVK